jgi:hypothetical protein
MIFVVVGSIANMKLIFWYTSLTRRVYLYMWELWSEIRVKMNLIYTWKEPLTCESYEGNICLNISCIFVWPEQVVKAIDGAVWLPSSCYALSAESLFKFCRLEATWRKEKKKRSVGDFVYFILSYPSSSSMPCINSQEETSKMKRKLLPALYIYTHFSSHSSSYPHTYSSTFKNNQSS